MNKIYSSEPIWYSENKEMGFYFQTCMVAADLFLVQARSTLSVLPYHLRGLKMWKSGLGRLVLGVRLPCSHLLECLVTCLGQITVQLLGPPLLLGPTDLSLLGLAGSSPFLFLLLKLSSLFPPLGCLPISFGLFKSQEKPLTSSYVCFLHSKNYE